MGAIFLVVAGFILILFSGIIVDVTAPIYSDALSQCALRSLFGSCTTYADFYKLFLFIIYFIVWALIIKLPIFLLFGFKTKTQLIPVTVATILLAAPAGFLGIFFGGRYLSAIQTVLIVIEVLFLKWRIKNEISTQKIAIAAAVASMIFFIVSRILESHHLWPLPFFSY